jgi:putative acetyltransferase
MSAYQVRPEREGDAEAVAEVVGQAFAPSVAEVQLVSDIRRSPEYRPELALVAVADNSTVIGFSMTSTIYLDTDGNGRVDVLGLAPVAVRPPCQRSGAGSALVEDGLRRADEAGAPLVVVLGHSSYYPRFGFERASLHGVRPPQPWNDESFMIRRLRAYDPSLRGTVVYPGTFGG